jgi:hypothetical protein
VESGGFWSSEIWQEGLLIFSFRYILSPAEFGQSGIETGMVPRLEKRNGTRIWLFVWHMPIAKQAIIAKQTITLLLIPHHHHQPLSLPPPSSHG